MEDIPINDEPKGLFDEEDDDENYQQAPLSPPVGPGTLPANDGGVAVDAFTPPPALFSEDQPPRQHNGETSMTEPPPAARSTSASSSPGEVFDVEPKLHIIISGYERRGEGMQSYVMYKVITKPVPGQSTGFTKKEYDVWRRFSDFLGLHDKLTEKHLPNGIIIPPAPDKNVLTATKSKITKTVEDDSGTSEFLERRRATLQRFLHRCCLHPTIMLDPDFRDFLTLEAELPKSTQTAALSGTSVLKLLGKVSDSFNRISIHIEDNDVWFQEKQNAIDDLNEFLRQLHTAFDILINQRKELAQSIEIFCKSLSLLAACEENTSLSKAFSVLSETLEKVSALEQDQADKELYLLAEVLKDYVGIVASVRDVFQERIKAWQNWQNAQLALAKKRENKTRLELAGKSDRVPAAKKEVQEYESKVQECEDSFAKLSRVIQREVSRFDFQRVHDFTLTIVQYLETLAESQQKLGKYWETFLPEAKSIVC